MRDKSALDLDPPSHPLQQRTTEGATKHPGSRLPSPTPTANHGASPTKKYWNPDIELLYPNPHVMAELSYIALVERGGVVVYAGKGRKKRRFLHR